MSKLSLLTLSVVDVACGGRGAGAARSVAVQGGSVRKLRADTSRDTTVGALVDEDLSIVGVSGRRGGLGSGGGGGSSLLCGGGRDG